ncbi:hypothetical protein BURKHO8Y_320002 [Burkholderia sp. 8Y]|nr:hypothetical protein BURKHO8Y_320002 [Burkholderia sp. 8Y]
MRWLRRSKKSCSGSLRWRVGLLLGRPRTISGFAILNMISCSCSVRETCVRVGLLVLPLPGAGVTFFAVDQSRRFSAVLWSHAKKVTKESSFFLAPLQLEAGHSAERQWHSVNQQP